MFNYVDPAGKTCDLVLVAYIFDDVPEHTILVRPHGNSKENKPYYRTMKSTVKQMTSLAMQTSKRAIDKVFNDKGVFKCRSTATWPKARILFK